MSDGSAPRTSLERGILEGVRFAARKAYEDILESRRGAGPIRKVRLIFGVPEGGAIRLLRMAADEAGGEPDEALYTLGAKVMGVTDENCLFHSGGGAITAIIREDTPDFGQPAALEAALAARLARLGGRAARNMRLLVSAPARVAPDGTAREEDASDGGAAESEPMDAALRRCHSQLEHLSAQCHMRPGVRVFVFDGPSARHLGGVPFPRLPLDALESALRDGDGQAFASAFDTFFEAMHKERLPDRVTILCLYKLAGLVGRVCHERGLTAAREPLERFAEAIGNDPDVCETAARALCAALFSQTGDTQAEGRNILRYIEAHYREALTLRQLSEHFSLSPAEIGCILRERGGRGFTETLQALRVEYAKRLIASSGLKLSTVCRESGFSDYSHFLQVFKRHTGMLPSRYKRKFG